VVRHPSCTPHPQSFSGTLLCRRAPRAVSDQRGIVSGGVGRHSGGGCRAHHVYSGDSQGFTRQCQESAVSGDRASAGLSLHCHAHPYTASCQSSVVSCQSDRSRKRDREGEGSTPPNLSPAFLVTQSFLLGHRGLAGRHSPNGLLPVTFDPQSSVLSPQS